MKNDTESIQMSNGEEKEHAWKFRHDSNIKASEKLTTEMWKGLLVPKKMGLKMYSIKQ